MKLYHFTDAKNLPSIRERGLVPAPLLAKPGFEHCNVVWLTLRPVPAADPDQTTMLTITLAEFDPRLWFDLEPDPEYQMEDWRLYHGTIPPDKIEFPA